MKSYLKSFILPVFLAFTCIAICLTSCKEEKTDVSDLISSVPSSAGGVVGINLATILDKSGCLVKDNTITPSVEAQKAIAGLAGTQKDIIDIFLSGNSGIDPTGAILFMDLGRTYLTFGLNDTEKFREFIESKYDEKFTETSGISVCMNVAVKGAQVWVALYESTIDPININGYASLSQSQSFLSTPFGVKMREMEHDIYGWGKINIFANKFLGFHEATVINMVSSTLFEGADQVILDADFKKGEFECEVKILNEKGKPAKYLLPADKIDKTTVKSIGGTANTVVAMSFNQKLKDKIDKLGLTLGGPAYKMISENLKDIDGTVAVGVGGAEGTPYQGVITTKGEPTLGLKQFVSQFAAVRADGKYLRFSNGDVSGNISLEKAAEVMDDACIAVVSEISSLEINNVNSDFIEYVYFLMEPEEGSIEIKFDIKAKDKKENFLKTMLQAFYD